MHFSIMKTWTGLSVLFAIVACGASQTINVVLITDSKYDLPVKSVDAAKKHLESTGEEAQLGEINSIVLDGEKGIGESMTAACEALDAAIGATETTPLVVLDYTYSGLPTQAAKAMVQSLSIPTFSGSMGTLQQFPAWQAMGITQEDFLLHFPPPGELAPLVVRAVLKLSNATDILLVVDNTFEIWHMHESMFGDLSIHYVIYSKDSASDEELANNIEERARSGFRDFFILGSVATISSVLQMAETKNILDARLYHWYALTKELEPITCASCKEVPVLTAQPEPGQNLEILKNAGLGDAQPALEAAFYFDLTLLAMRTVALVVKDKRWPDDPLMTCASFEEGQAADQTGTSLEYPVKWMLEKADQGKAIFGEFNLHDQNRMSFTMAVKRAAFKGGEVSSTSFAKWQPTGGRNGKMEVISDQPIYDEVKQRKLKIMTVLQPPFVMESKDKSKGPFVGYCIDMIEEIAKRVPFTYDIELVPDGLYGFQLEGSKEWDGLVRQLIDGNIDIGLGAMSVMAEREVVIDFTYPFTDYVGTSILMKRIPPMSDLFKFLTVLEMDVWFCIMAAYFFTSLLLWIFDRWSPYSYQNNMEKFKDDEEKRLFTPRECLWFCITSLTPQGGGEAPKNMSGRLVAATWWLFGFIIIASYTANLAAFLTVSKLEIPIEHLEDLARQYRIQYSAIKNSSSEMYFERMSKVEDKFYEIWKDMSLNDSLDEYERSRLAVWDYPISDKYTKIYQAMKESGFRPSYDVAEVDILKSSLQSGGFALLGEGTILDYATMTNCVFKKVGPEFSRKPYALAVQKGSPLKEVLSKVLQDLWLEGFIEKLRMKWWVKNPKRVTCGKDPNDATGIRLPDIGGVFIMVFGGIGIGIITLTYEFFNYKYRLGGIPHTRVTEKVGNPTPGSIVAPSAVNMVGVGIQKSKMPVNPFQSNFGAQFSTAPTHQGSGMAPLDKAW